MNKLLSVALLLLCGCASYTPTQNARVAQARIESKIPTHWLHRVPNALQQTNTWTQIYDDPLLAKYLEQAARANLDIHITQTHVRQSEANLRQSKSLLLPRLDASLSASGAALLKNLDNPSENYGSNFSGFWDPDIFGKNKAVIAASQAQLMAQNALADKTRQSVLAQTARAYIRAVEADLQVGLAKKNLAFLKESRRISEARYRLGDTAKSDFSFAEANYYRALANFENTVQSARLAKRALSVLLGDYPSEDIELSKTLNRPKILPPRALPAKILARRPDIVNAQALIAERYANLIRAHRADWPSLTLNGNLSAGSGNLKSLFDPQDYIASLAARLAANVFDGGEKRATRERAKSQLDGALLRYEQSLKDAMAQITNIYDRAQTIDTSLDILQNSSAAANEALRLKNIQYNLGETSLLDILQVQSRVNAIDTSLIRTKSDLLINTINAYEAIGGFGQNPL